MLGNKEKMTIDIANNPKDSMKFNDKLVNEGPMIMMTDFYNGHNPR